MSYCNLTKADRESVYIEVPFIGNQIEFFSRTEDNMGDYEITIRNQDGDTVQQEICSAYSEVRTDAVSLFKSDVLPDDFYVLTLKCLSGDYLIVDAFRVLSENNWIDQIVVEPISVTADGVRVSELTSGKTLEITAPVANNGTTDEEIAVMAVLSGGDGAAQMENSGAGHRCGRGGQQEGKASDRGAPGRK